MRPETPCTFFEGATCWHRDCRLHILAKDRPTLATQLRRNDNAKDWLGNWGRFDKDAPRRSEPRRRVAKIVRMMRRGKMDYAQATCANVWADALGQKG